MLHYLRKNWTDYRATQKKVLSPGVRPCILYVFEVAESESGVR